MSGSFFPVGFDCNLQRKKKEEEADEEEDEMKNSRQSKLNPLRFLPSVSTFYIDFSSATNSIYEIMNLKLFQLNQCQHQEEEKKKALAALLVVVSGDSHKSLLNYA